MTPEQAETAFSEAPADPISETDQSWYMAFIEEIDNLRLEVSNLTLQRDRIKDDLDNCKNHLASAANQRQDAMLFFNASEDRRADLLRTVKELLTVVMPKDCTADGIVERAYALVRTEEGG